MGEIIGRFCSVAKKGTIIMPKEIPGYKTPEGQVLRENGQRFNFAYDPIEYDITYNLDGGRFDGVEPKYSYTVENPEYFPPRPVKDDNKFVEWNPKSIPHGSTGVVSFSARWKPNAILLKGSKLAKALVELTGDKNNIMAIQQASSVPSGNYVNISSTDTPIFASFADGIVSIFCEDDIYCNMDMRNAFSGMTILRDISALYNFICKENTDISGLFKDCVMLSDVSAVSEWANSGKFKNFTNAFTNTSALQCMRVPKWYRWNVKINYMSSSGATLDVVTEDRVPGEIVYPKAFGGYKAVTESVVIDSNNKEYTFVYEPIKYTISYALNGGEILNPKTSYTIEDETYYPPEAVKPGYRFDGWIPPCIEHGEYGNASFVAKFSV